MTRRSRSEAALGDREWALLRFVAENGPISVGDATASFGGSEGLARTTVLTMMQRLHAKGRLTRRRVRGVYRYASRVPASRLLADVVHRFVQGPLGGSLSPFAAYLADADELDDAEIREIQAALQRLRRRKAD